MAPAILLSSIKFAVIDIVVLIGNSVSKEQLKILSTNVPLLNVEEPFS
jgi:hypothetical protein